uniref:uncharacterized protein K02A2.6-like n=1 Tax=Monopterus albus TaxID=43700 RepID=UPI0009B42CC6|nr:uncharacterized protein K02A2.6-like [Monopterus albus]
MDVVTNGGSTRLPEFQPYNRNLYELSVRAGCLLWGQRVLVPPTLQNRVLQQLHHGHCGMVRMKELARSYFWWPGLNKQIEETARTCPSCQKFRNMPQPAPLHPWEWPEEPWKRVHIDFAGPFEDRMFLVAVDAHSKWPEVCIMRSTTTEKTVERLGEMFSRFGFPEQLVSDNGPQFTAPEFEKFLDVNGIQHIRSAPYHPSTNGLAERFIQSMKQALKASVEQGSLHQRLNNFLLSYRNVPHSTTKVAPSELFIKRKLRTFFDLLKPPQTKDIVLQKQRAQVERRSLRARERIFHPGDQVLARNYHGKQKWVPAKVIAQTGPVSYTVETPENVVWRRHTDQLLHGPRTPVDPPEGDTELYKHASPTPSAWGQTQSSPTPVAVPDTELSAPPIPVSIPVAGEPPVDNIVRRYPQRERRPPVRMNL